MELFAQLQSRVVLPPPLKWAGGKRWLVPHLLPFWERHRNRRLVEPFVGGMGVTLSLLPQRALLNDINPHLINFYRWLQKGLRVEGVPFRNDKDTYYANRERFNALIREGKADTPEAALLFYYLNRTGYNGLCRFNQAGLFNVPFGRYKSISYITGFGPYQEIMKGWAFRAGDFQELSEELEEGDFLYADPPYDVPFTQYTKEGFGWDDQVRLARWLSELDLPVVASNQATERILDLYTGLGFKVRILKAPRRIACNGDRTPADEMLAWKGL